MIFKKIFSRFKGRCFCLRTKNHKSKRIKIHGKVFLRQKPNIILGNNISIYNNVIFWGPGKINIGNNCAIGDNVIIYSSTDGGVNIGSNSLIAANSYIIDQDHSFKREQLIRLQKMNTKKIIIGDDVWVGANSTILKGVIIGDGAVVGANSLVNKNVEPYTVVGGVPAKELKKRI